MAGRVLDTMIVPYDYIDYISGERKLVPAGTVVKIWNATVNIPVTQTITTVEEGVLPTTTIAEMNVGNKARLRINHLLGSAKYDLVTLVS